MQFRNRALDYVRTEDRLIDTDLQEHENLSPEGKEEIGILIRDAQLVASEGPRARYSTPINNTKLRNGDKVKIVARNATWSRTALIELNAIEEIVVTTDTETEFPTVADVHVVEYNGLGNLIKLLSEIRVGAPGIGYLKHLSGMIPPLMNGLGGVIDIRDDEIPSSFSPAQAAAIRMIARRPSLAYVQGIPGSGKTYMIAVASKILTLRRKDVVVVALTHQAVNNALNKVVEMFPDVEVAKIGPESKNEGLRMQVAYHTSFVEYIKERRQSGHFIANQGRVVGMTFQSAIINLGQRKTAFMPQVLLFDEAGQMPLAHASVLGSFKCGSVVLVGDDAQMPPIYHPGLVGDELSRSIFEHVKQLYPQAGIVLNMTYRMNDEIAACVGRGFYLPRGVELVCSNDSLGNVIKRSRRPWFGEGESAFEFHICSSPGAKDENPDEAGAVVETVSRYLSLGIPIHRVAVITPYRRQVRLIRKLAVEKLGRTIDLPLIDTVERLQGQDVEVIAISFSVDDRDYFRAQQEFVLNGNRLNVMISRATSKVEIFCSSIVRDHLSFLKV